MNDRYKKFAAIPMLLLAACFESPMERAQDHFVHGRFVEAAAEYRKAGGVPEARFGEARSLYLSRDWSGAATVLDELLASEPSTEIRDSAAVLRAYCAYSLFDFDGAARRAAELGNDLPPAFAQTDLAQLKKNLLEKRGELFQADELMSQGSYDTAAKIAWTAYHANPITPFRAQLLATWTKARAQSGDSFTPNELEVVLLMAKQLDESDALDLRALDEIAQAYFHAREFKPAIAIWSEIERIAGDWRSIATDSTDAGMFAALGVQPKNDLAHLYRRGFGRMAPVWRARAALAVGDTGLAEDLYLSINKSPWEGWDEDYHSADARIALARINGARGDYVAALEFLSDTTGFSYPQLEESKRLVAAWTDTQ